MYDPTSPFYLSRRRFEELVSEAMDQIPDALWAAVDNVAVVVEEWPTRRQIDSTAARQAQPCWVSMKGCR